MGGAVADFAAAFAATMKTEGGWAHDPLDRGGETYRGIARRWHPTWPGWAIVDRAKRDGRFDAHRLTAQDREQLAALTAALYRATYWDAIRGDAITDDGVAAELFDTGVNASPGAAALLLQRTLNVLNRRGTLWPDLALDAELGPRTLAALEAATARGEAPLVLHLLNALQAARFVAIMEKDPSQERFARGWLSRT